MQSRAAWAASSASARSRKAPGYYISQPVRRDGKIVGAAVVKLDLEWFQGSDASEPLLVTDDHGVIFLSSVPAWGYHTIRPLSGQVADSVTRRVNMRSSRSRRCR